MYLPNFHLSVLNWTLINLIGQAGTNTASVSIETDPLVSCTDETIVQFEKLWNKKYHAILWLFMWLHTVTVKRINKYKYK